MKEDVAEKYSIKKTSVWNPHFVHVRFENTGYVILPQEYTGDLVGIGYAFYDENDELVNESKVKPFDCILLPGESVELSIPLTNAPRRTGAYKLVMWICCESNMEGELLLEREVMFELR